MILACETFIIIPNEELFIISIATVLPLSPAHQGALSSVKAGTADIAVVDYFIAANAINEGGDYGGLVILNKTFPDEEYAIAFRKKSPVTLEKINGAIKELQESGKLKEIAEKYGLYDLMILK